MRNRGLVVLLVTLWILAWGQITLANLLSGVVVTVALLLAFPRHRDAHGNVRFNVFAALRLAGYVASQLVLSNAVMTRQILRRDTARTPGVVAHRLHRASEEVATVMSSVIALSPGTMTVDVERDSSTICVHFFDLTDLDAARAGLVRLERRVTDAIAGGLPVDPAAVHDPPSDRESP